MPFSDFHFIIIWNLMNKISGDNDLWHTAWLCHVVDPINFGGNSKPNYASYVPLFSVAF